MGGDKMINKYANTTDIINGVAVIQHALCNDSAIDKYEKNVVDLVASDTIRIRNRFAIKYQYLRYDSTESYRLIVRLLDNLGPYGGYSYETDHIANINLYYRSSVFGMDEDRKHRYNIINLLHEIFSNPKECMLRDSTSIEYKIYCYDSEKMKDLFRAIDEVMSSYNFV